MRRYAPCRDSAGPPEGHRSCGSSALRGGFSLPELLTVLVVVGVMSVLVIPRIEVVKYRMDGQARGMMAALVTAQRSAVKRQHDVVVAFDTTNHRIRIHEDANNNGAMDAGERTRHVPLDETVEFGLGGAPARSGGTAPSVSFTDLQGGLPVIRFRRSGSASQEGSFYITSQRSRRGPGYANDTRSVQVDRATGRVAWYYYESPDWRLGF